MSVLLKNGTYSQPSRAGHLYPLTHVSSLSTIARVSPLLHFTAAPPPSRLLLCSGPFPHLLLRRAVPFLPSDRVPGALPSTSFSVPLSQLVNLSSPFILLLLPFLLLLLLLHPPPLTAATTPSPLIRMQKVRCSLPCCLLPCMPLSILQRIQSDN